MNYKWKCLTADDVVEYFISSSREEFHRRKAEEGLYVVPEVRQELLAGERQGKIIVDGRATDLRFTDIKGGVWKVYVQYHRNI